jgi:hypothetical protein
MEYFFLGNSLSDAEVRKISTAGKTMVKYYLGFAITIVILNTVKSQYFIHFEGTRMLPFISRYVLFLAHFCKKVAGWLGHFV